MGQSSCNYSLVLDSPLGRLGVLLDGHAVTRLDYLTRRTRLQPARTRAEQRVERELKRFFDNPGVPFTVAVAGRGTAFQMRVWTVLQSIPPGETHTYGQVAAQLGSGPRAVGNACRRNPVSIIVPCHRVVAASGMGGYSGKTADPAIWRKHWLLSHEGADCAGLKSAKLPQAVTVHREIQRTSHA
jgi:methylated-DNA-[protein]-cysteine S-methyltransferase